MAIYRLNGIELPEGVDITLGGFTYPYSWLDSASPSVLASYGIHKDNNQFYDPRYYWAPGAPKELEDIPATGDHGAPVYVKVWDPETKEMVDTDKQVINIGLKTTTIAEIKNKTNELLKPTDFYIIRNHVESTEIPEQIVTYRAAVVTESARLQNAIPAVTSVEELISVMNSVSWPRAE